jgi:hypothetical protein
MEMGEQRRLEEWREDARCAPSWRVPHAEDEREILRACGEGAAREYKEDPRAAIAFCFQQAARYVAKVWTVGSQSRSIVIDIIVSHRSFVIN